MNRNVFKSWAPDWLIKGVLIFCMLHCMVLLGVYSSNVTYSASFLDVETEDLQFAMSITYGTFLATLMVESRIFKFFPTRNYFIGIYMCAAITFIASAYTHDYILFCVLRVVEGMLMALPWVPLRILLLTRFKSNNATILVFSFTYGMLLMASPFIMSIVVWLLDNYDWKFMAYGSAFFQFLCVTLILITFNGNRFHRKTPLYQVDWASFILIHTTILCGAFVLVYGEKKYWFQSTQIIIAAILCSLTAALFIARQLLQKRPCFDLTVFKYPNLRTGFVLFVLFYISRSTLNICHTTMSKVWDWEPTRIANLQYFNVAGDLIGIVIAGIMMSKKVPTRYIFIVGFALMGISHFWFTFLFVPDVSFYSISYPYILQGIAVGILFVPLVLFTVSSVPAHLAPFSGTVGASGRFWGNTIGFSLMQNLQVIFQQNHIDKLKQSVISESPEMQNRIDLSTQNFISKGFTHDQAYLLALKSMNETLKKQAILLSNMEIFTMIGVGLTILVFLIIINRHLSQSFDIFKNRIWGS